MRVLVVDDASFMRMMLRTVLEGLGHEIVGEARNGAEALEEYKKVKPDIVTMDITMSDVDGLQGVTLIKNYDPSARIIMCSAMGQQAMVLDAIQRGAIDFIVKPFQPDRINEALRKIRL